MLTCMTYWKCVRSMRVSLTVCGVLTVSWAARARAPAHGRTRKRKMRRKRRCFISRSGDLQLPGVGGGSGKWSRSCRSDVGPNVGGDEPAEMADIGGGDGRICKSECVQLSGEDGVG